LQGPDYILSTAFSTFHTSAPSPLAAAAALRGGYAHPHLVSELHPVLVAKPSCPQALKGLGCGLSNPHSFYLTPGHYPGHMVRTAFAALQRAFCLIPFRAMLGM
jgi:hypothetical protein